MLNFATIWNTVRTAITGHPVIAAVSVAAVISGVVLRVTGWDLKLLDGYGRMQQAEGAWAQNTASKLGKKRLAKAVARADKKAEKARKHEAVRVEKAAKKAAEAEARALAAAQAAAKVKAA